MHAPDPVRAPEQAAPPLLVGPRVWARRGRIAASQLALLVRNRWGRRSVLGDAPVVVSLTTYGRRLRSVHHALESIGRGAVRPTRLILWVDHETAAGELTAALRGLCSRGVEVLATEDLGPHTKYYPYVRSTPRHTLPLVTADDDTLYPRDWLAGLVTAYQDHPDDVSCLRAHVVTVRDGAIAPYDTWPPCEGREARTTNFATGVSGVIYPPAMLERVREAGERFRTVCLANDDIWLHHVALRSGIAVRQAGPRPREFPTTLLSQRESLRAQNVSRSRNDRLVEALYAPADVAVLEARAGISSSMPR